MKVTLKTCRKCKASLNAREFNKNSRSADGKDYLCRPCSSGKQAGYRAKMSDAEKRVDRNKNREAKKKVRAFNNEKVLEILKSSSCKDCGVDNHLVLEFDHVVGSKVLEICTLRSFSCWTKLKKELAKCEVVCANCHRIRTTERAGSWRSKTKEELEVELAELKAKAAELSLLTKRPLVNYSRNKTA